MIDNIQNIQSSACGTGACTQSANPQNQAITSRGSQSNDTVKISKQGREQLKRAVSRSNRGHAG